MSAALATQWLTLACLLGGLLAGLVCVKRVLRLQNVGRERLAAGVERRRLGEDAQVMQASRAVRRPLALAVALLAAGLLAPALLQRVLA
ncbi:MAG: hypothetical protein QM601_09535 [Pseudoxanthomonas sp.]